jgi:hypothetical protein
MDKSRTDSHPVAIELCPFLLLATDNDRSPIPNIKPCDMISNVDKVAEMR